MWNVMDLVGDAQTSGERKEVDGWYAYLIPTRLQTLGGIQYESDSVPMRRYLAGYWS